MELVNLIGKGAQAEVYEYKGNAVKLFHKEYDKQNIFYEAMINTIIEKTGLPIPCIKRVFKLNDSWAIEMDLIEGTTLNNLFNRQPCHVEEYINEMVKLQIKVHSYELSSFFSLKSKLKDKISRLNIINDNIKIKLLTKLNTLPEDNKLCHGDFHPLNLIKKDNTIYIIDWIDAASGNPEADICRTYLIFLLYIKEMAEIYLESYCINSKKSKDDITKWLPIIAAARLIENNPNEKDRLITIINRDDKEGNYGKAIRER